MLVVSHRREVVVSGGFYGFLEMIQGWIPCYHCSSLLLFPLRVDSPLSLLNDEELLLIVALICMDGFWWWRNMVEVDGGVSS